MATKTDKLVIHLSVDGDGKVHASLAQTANDLDQVGQGGRKSSGSISQLSGAYKLLTGAAAGYIGLGTVKTILAEADAYTALTTRIKTATKDTGDFVQVQQRLFEISQANGAELESTVSVFQGLARVSAELGATNEDILLLTDTVQKLGVIGGSTTESMKNGLLQFTQAMASGTVRAEEMNSILENMPEVAARIAEGMNMTTGELRRAVAEGKVLSEQVFNALLKQAPEISAEFEDIPVTIDRAATSLGNSMQRLIGELNEATGITENIAAAMQTTSTRIDALTRALGESEGTLSDMWIILQAMSQPGYLAGLQAEFAQVDEEVRQLSAILKQTSDENLPIFIEELSNLLSSAGVSGKAFAQVMELVDQRLQQAGQSASGTAKEFAEFDKELAAAEETIQKAKKSDAELVEQLQAELELMKLSDAERAVEVELRKLSGAATIDQKAAVEQLVRQMEALKEAEKQAKAEQKAMTDEMERFDKELAEAEAELDRISTTTKGWIDDLETSAQRLELEASMINATNAERQAALILFDLEAQARQQNITLTDEQIAQATELAQRIATQQEAIDAAAQATKQYEQIWNNTIENIQRAWADSIYDMLFVDGIDSFGDFFDAILDMFKQLLAQMLAAWSVDFLTGLFSTGGNIASAAAGATDNLLKGIGLKPSTGAPGVPGAPVPAASGGGAAAGAVGAAGSVGVTTVGGSGALGATTGVGASGSIGITSADLAAGGGAATPEAAGQLAGQQFLDGFASVANAAAIAAPIAVLGYGFVDTFFNPNTTDLFKEEWANMVEAVGIEGLAQEAISNPINFALQDVEAGFYELGEVAGRTMVFIEGSWDEVNAAAAAMGETLFNTKEEVDALGGSFVAIGTEVSKAESAIIRMTTQAAYDFGEMAIDMSTTWGQLMGYLVETGEYTWDELSAVTESKLGDMQSQVELFTIFFEDGMVSAAEAATLGIELMEDVTVDAFLAMLDEANALNDEISSLGINFQQAANEAANLTNAANQAAGASQAATGGSGASGGGATPEGSFDVGTAYVPRDMVAQVHRGERILTASENNDLIAAVRQLQSTGSGPACEAIVQALWAIYDQNQQVVSNTAATAQNTDLTVSSFQQMQDAMLADQRC